MRAGKGRRGIGKEEGRPAFFFAITGSLDSSSSSRIGAVFDWGVSEVAAVGVAEMAP